MPQPLKTDSRANSVQIKVHKYLVLDPWVTCPQRLTSLGQKFVPISIVVHSTEYRDGPFFAPFRMQNSPPNPVAKSFKESKHIWPRRRRCRRLWHGRSRLSAHGGAAATACATCARSTLQLAQCLFGKMNNMVDVYVVIRWEESAQSFANCWFHLLQKKYQNLKSSMKWWTWVRQGQNNSLNSGNMR